MVLAFCSFALAALLLFPQACTQSAREALIIWGLHVTPSLFPYMVFSKMLTQRLTNSSCPPSIVCVLLGMLGGAPTGAAVLSSYSARLTDKAILALCALTGTVSPMFFLGTVSSWTNDAFLSSRLLISQFGGAILSAIVVSQYPSKPMCHKSNGTVLSDSPLSQSIDAVLQVGGCIICFSVAAGILRLFPLPGALICTVHALLEISGGMHAIIRCSAFSSQIKNVLLAFSAGFGGLSVLFQNYLFLRSIGVRLSHLLGMSLLRAAFASVIMLLLI